MLVILTLLRYITCLRYMKIDKLVTTVRDCVSTFVSVKPPDIFKGDLRPIPICFCGDKKTDAFEEQLGHLHLCL